jgi:hypothetical protein
LLIGLSALAYAAAAHAQEIAPPSPSRFEIKGGILAHDVPGLWSGFSLEKGIDLNVEMLFGQGMPFLGGTIRPAIGGSVNFEGYTSKGYVDARWEVDLPHRLFFGLGIGAAIHDGKLEPTARRWARACYSTCRSRSASASTSARASPSISSTPRTATPPPTTKPSTTSASATA